MRSVDGGVGYYDKFENGLPSSPNFFPHRGVVRERV